MLSFDKSFFLYILHLYITIFDKALIFCDFNHVTIIIPVVCSLLNNEHTVFLIT